MAMAGLDLNGEDARAPGHLPWRGSNLSDAAVSSERSQSEALDDEVRC